MGTLNNPIQVRERLGIHIRSVIYSTIRLFELGAQQPQDLALFECVMDLAERAEVRLMENEAARIQKALGKYYPGMYFEPSIYWFKYIEEKES